MSVFADLESGLFTVHSSEPLLVAAQPLLPPRDHFLSLFLAHINTKRSDTSPGTFIKVMAWRGADPQGGQASAPEILVELSLPRAGGIPPVRAHVPGTHFWGWKPRGAGAPPSRERPLTRTWNLCAMCKQIATRDLGTPAVNHCPPGPAGGGASSLQH